MNIGVMIVEDEPVVLKTIREVITKTNNSFKIVAEASDGEQALSMMETARPDVVFTDIRMPVMDGLTLVEKIREREYDTIPVVLSGYQEFDYSKKAIKLDVFDYLLKPPPLDDLKTLLNDIYRRVWKKTHEKQTDMLSGILYGGHMVPECEEGNISALLGFDRFIMMLVCSGPFSAVASPLQIMPQFLELYKGFDKTVEKRFGSMDSFWILDGRQINEKVIIKGIPASESNDEFKKPGALYSDLSSRGRQVTAVVSTVARPSEMIGKMQKSRTVLGRKIKFAHSSCWHIERIEPQAFHPAINALENDLMHTIEACIRNGNIEELKKAFDGFLDKYGTYEIEQYKLEGMFHNIMSAIYYNHSNDPLSTDVDMAEQISEMICSSPSYKALSENFKAFIDLHFSPKSPDDRQKDGIYQKSIADRVEEYIRSNYPQQLSLQDLSEKFGLVPWYLSSIYKKEKGLSPIKHLTMVRIEEASRMLVSSPSAGLNEIARSVGFNDPFYMSKVFKAITGKNPSEFRKQSH